MKEKNINDLISIIIPMYNSENYIGKLLESLINQTYKNLEIIIVDDGSSDNSLKKALEYEKKDKRIKIITQKNSGVSSARNVGLKNVKGEYFTFLDSDDYIEFDMYEKMMNTMVKVNTDVIRINYVKETENCDYISEGNLFDLKDKILNKTQIKDKLIPYLFENKIEAYTPLLLIKSDLLNKIKPFIEDIHIMEDLLFYLDLLSNINTIYFLDIKSYHYILRSSSSSKRRDRLLLNLRDTIKVIKHVISYLKRNNLDESVYKKVYLVYSSMIVKYLLRTFQENDEYYLTFNQLCDILDTLELSKIFSNVNLSSNNEYIDKSINLILNKKYDEFYKYALSIRNIKI